MTKARDISKLLSTANGKIAGENLDVSFENITDTGTEGTKVASGTTAQRGSTTGQLRFNTTTGLAEYYNGSAFKAIDNPPTVTSLDVTEVDSQAGGNQTIVITGGNFQSGATVTFVGATGTNFNASTVTLDSDTQITAVAPKASFLNAQEPYGVKVQNVSGLSSTLASQINVDSAPTWSTASGSLGNVYETSNDSFSVSATDVDGETITYSLLSGSLPSGYSLNTTTGAITGTAPSVSGDTTSNFTIRATANSKNVDRAFSITVKNLNYSNIDIVNFTSDNCSDQGTIINTSISYDFGTPRYVGRTYFYSVYQSALVSINVSVEYSDDNSSWTTAFSGVHSNNSSCGVFYDTGSPRSFSTALSYGAHRYWRLVPGSFISGIHYPRASRIGLEVLD